MDIGAKSTPRRAKHEPFSALTNRGRLRIVSVRWGLLSLKLSLILGFSALIGGCADESTLTAEFSATRQPQLVVIVSMDSSGATSEDFDLRSSDKTRLYVGGNPNALLACAKYLQWIAPTFESGGLSGPSSCLGTTDASVALAAHFKSILGAGLAPPAQAYSATAFTLKSNASGVVFLVSFYDLDKSVGNRCFQLTASEIRGGKFYALDSGAQSSSLAFTVTDTPYPATGDDPVRDRTKCFKF